MIGNQNLMSNNNLSIRPNFVAVSNWLKEKAIQSGIIEKDQIRVIYNSVDTNVFYPQNGTDLLRQKHGISTNKPVVLIGARNLSEAYKGAQKIIQVIEKYKDQMFFVFYGRNSQNIEQAVDTIECVHMGFVDETTLAELYNLSDIFLMLSTQEAFGKTVIESLACKTPVYVVEDTGPHEIIKALGMDSSKLINGSCLHQASRIEPSFEDVRKMFGLETIAQEYLDYYKALFTSTS